MSSAQSSCAHSRQPLRPERACNSGRARFSAARADNGGVNSPDTIAVIDFETTGISPGQGARATEIAAVLVRDGRIVDRYQSLMHSGAWVSPFIEQFTGISNRMLASAPPAAQVMREVAAFTAGCGLVAHNAAFDRGFWRHELALAGDGAAAEPAFACTLLLSRRLYPDAPNHQLGTLARWHGITATGRAHRALADAETTAELWLRITQDVRGLLAAAPTLQPSFDLLCTLQRTPRSGLARAATRYLAGHARA